MFYPCFGKKNIRNELSFQIQPEEFVSDFEKQYPAYKWSDIEVCFWSIYFLCQFS